MNDIWSWLVNPTGLTPHGFCLTWAPGLIWLHAISDIVIGLAYFSIPVALTYFLMRRKDVEFRWIVYLFVGFIMACGMTHFMSVYVLWVAAYGVEGLLKLVTAILSVITAGLLWPLIPRLLALPSPTQMTALNVALSNKIDEQERTNHLLIASEERVRSANAELEARVVQRTADLTSANASLEATLEDLRETREELVGMVKEREDALQQRNLLLREVYHRVKNNLQIVDAIITMQEGELNDERARAALQSLRSRIYALGLVHQQLMTSRDLQTFDIAPFLKELAENVVAAGAMGDIALEVEADELPVNLDYAVPLGLLVTELVTNAIKHAFPDGNGRISVTLVRHAEDDRIDVTVADNGQGDKTDEASRTGLGKRLIQGLVQQLQGRMDIQWQKGTMARVTLPTPKLV
ncbi:sensor histidine kinase [Sphingobium nicotianae]|uniref:histidine kinase n=1 Tax=Sphingobium nicotianae TaxID=2782607 RepID=A0A9X1DG88_9SPHN|nr:sensor histidine kinase [Sphingobium nicotianae]MBT2189334.1 ATP-binding protein [Sphingobium nicotianae]